MKTRCKVVCTKETRTITGKEYTFMPVTATSPENQDFFKFTPYGEFNFGSVNENVNFDVGKEYFVDFTEAE